MIGALVSTVTALALLVGVAVLVTTGRGRLAVRVLLDLLIAAGLLRLAAHRGWTDLLGAGAIVALRQLIWASLARRPGSPRQSARRCGEEDHHLPLAVGEAGENGRMST
ncbi:hypothetical protein [Micromonospora sp. WMMD812]|uniref:hypothetical protein n=1 Tax=Micromonospora sp. WMMD812 TaxID=3015152 RepID=UPI00248B181F|nr:hypothetical protein [Micromonospora sp. WMMD812]WBB68973.1 hypothetical protein O7603_06345 [Micromonospora sp. WMMD812]